MVNTLIRACNDNAHEHEVVACWITCKTNTVFIKKLISASKIWIDHYGSFLCENLQDNRKYPTNTWGLIHPTEATIPQGKQDKKAGVSDYVQGVLSAAILWWDWPARWCEVLVSVATQAKIIKVSMMWLVNNVCIATFKYPWQYFGRHTHGQALG